MKKNQIVVLENGNGLVTKAFEKQARIFGTAENIAWREFVKVYPSAKMEIKIIKKNTKNDTYRRNMTYDNMREYIKTEPNSKEVLKEFDNVIIKSKVQTCPYDYVANWFIAKFPNYKTNEIFVDKEKEENETTKKDLKFVG